MGVNMGRGAFTNNDHRSNFTLHCPEKDQYLDINLTQCSRIKDSPGMPCVCLWSPMKQGKEIKKDHSDLK